MAQNMYRLKVGSKHTARRGGKLIPLKPGDTVLLNGTALKAFGDKFEKAFEVDEEVISGKPMKRLSTSEAAKRYREESQSKPEPEDEEDDDDLEDDDEPELEKTHRGSGRWIVTNRETGEKTHEGYLTKDEAIALVEG